MPCGKSDIGKQVWIGYVWRAIRKDNLGPKIYQFKIIYLYISFFLKISIIVLYKFHYCSEKIRLQSSKTCIIKLTTKKWFP